MCHLDLVVESQLCWFTNPQERPEQATACSNHREVQGPIFSAQLVTSPVNLGVVFAGVAFATDLRVESRVGPGRNSEDQVSCFLPGPDPGVSRPDLVDVGQAPQCFCPQLRPLPSRWTTFLQFVLDTAVLHGQTADAEIILNFSGL